MISLIVDLEHEARPELAVLHAVPGPNLGGIAVVVGLERAADRERGLDLDDGRVRLAGPAFARFFPIGERFAQPPEGLEGARPSEPRALTDPGVEQDREVLDRVRVAPELRTALGPPETREAVFLVRHVRARDRAAIGVDGTCELIAGAQHVPED